MKTVKNPFQYLYYNIMSYRTCLTNFLTSVIYRDISREEVEEELEKLSEHLGHIRVLLNNKKSTTIPNHITQNNLSFFLIQAKGQGLHSNETHHSEVLDMISKNSVSALLIYMYNMCTLIEERATEIHSLYIQGTLTEKNVLHINEDWSKLSSYMTTLYILFGNIHNSLEKKPRYKLVSVTNVRKLPARNQNTGKNKVILRVVRVEK